MTVHDPASSSPERLRVRITKQPQDADFTPIAVAHFRVGEVYEVGVALGTLLVVSSHAVAVVPPVNQAADAEGHGTPTGQ